MKTIRQSVFLAIFLFTILNIHSQEKRDAGVFQIKDVNGGVEITEYNGKNVSLSIPEKIDGKIVVSIGNKAFEGHKLTNIQLPNTINSIGKKAFAENNLTSVVIPNSVISLGEEAFYANQLKSVTISKNLTKIKAFTFCMNKLSKILLPDNITFIEEFAFTDNLLTNVTLPNDIQQIGLGAFQKNMLSSIEIPYSINFIGKNAFDVDFILPSPIKPGYKFINWKYRNEEISAGGLVSCRKEYSAQFKRVMSRSMMKNYVDPKMKKWLIRDLYNESAEDYKKRITKVNQIKKSKDFENEWVSQQQTNLVPVVKEYNKDWNELKLVFSELPSITLKVAEKEAESLMKNELDINEINFIFNEEDILSIASASVNGYKYIDPNYKTATYSNMKIENKKVEDEKTKTNDNKIVSEEKTKEIELSDVDMNIPIIDTKLSNSFAVIIGNENYDYEIEVKYAKNDASVFKKYAENTLGVPNEHIHYLENATFGKMLKEIQWINNIAKAYNGEARIIFYYAGHGMPDFKTEEAYLLPTDGSASSIRTAISLGELYTSLNEYPTKQTTVFLDACFSGGARDGMLTTGRGVIVKPKDNNPKGNMIVFSAVSGKQIAHPYEEKHHGLFSYYLLKKIQETNGNISFGELADYIKIEVNKKSIVDGKEQTPQINISPEILNNWRKWTFN